MKVKQKNIFIITILACLIFCFSVSLTYAETASEGSLIENNLIDDLDQQTSALKMKSGLAANSPGYIAAIFIKALLSFLGVIFIILIIYSGIIWMTSSGNEEQITKAKKIITGAIIGFVICLGAYTITVFVTNQIFLSGIGSRPL